MLKEVTMLPHANVLEEKLNPTGQYHFWNSNAGLSYQLLTRTTQSNSSAAAAVQHVPKEE